MTKIWQLLITYIGIPLIREALVTLYTKLVAAISEYKRKRKIKKRIKNEIDKFKQSDSKDSHNDSFDGLP